MISKPAAGRTVVPALSPLTLAVFVAFLIIGSAMPVLPLHVRDTLGFGPATMGGVAGCQFAAALVARVWSGRVADRRGPKWGVVAGLGATACAGLIYLLSLAFLTAPRVSVAILLVGRAVLGGAESFIITGATTWGLSRVGAHNAGKVIAWMGTAMFLAFAAGAPLGVALHGRGGFGWVAAATTGVPLLTLALIGPLRGAAPAPGAVPSILSVARRIWLPGLGAALSSIGFGAIAAFGSLLFVEHGWTPVWFAFSAYALALILARLLFGHLPDRIGGARVALIFVSIEVVGLAVMGLAGTGWTAAIGAALTGFGYALVFPALGVEAVRRALSESRGVAMGAYTACLDLALGISGPVLGALGGHVGTSAIFLAGGAAVLGAGGVSFRLLFLGGEPRDVTVSPGESTS